MSIKITKKEFEDGVINKVEFINKMHEFHKVLFDYSNNLKDTEISKIILQQGSIIFTSKSTYEHPMECSFYVDIIDKRVTPLDTFNFNVYEKEDSKMLFNLIENGDTIFDIGANIGWYSNHLAKKNPNSILYCFEPIPETYLQLKNNSILNSNNNLKLYNFALSSKKEKIIFYTSPYETGASSSQNITENKNMIKIECEADTIDNFCFMNKVDKLDFIKCDVEGAEFFVFQGGKETFKKFKPIIFTEMLRKWAAKFGYHPNDIISYFSNFGYNCFVSNNSKLKLVETVNDETIETNFFFLHPILHEQKIKLYS